MKLTRKDVQKVSLLARLQLDDEELDRMTAQLGRIVQYVELLSETDTEHIQPMAHAFEMRNVMANDEETPSLDREQVLANAPKRDTECYRVPAVLGD